VETDQFLSVDTCRNSLLEARSFAKWCAGKNWLKGENPLASVEGVGKRRHGKPQLRIDDARVWTAKAMELAQAGDDGALAGLIALYMANRASEITKRRVGDVDDDGALLWIEEGKTDKSNGAVTIPDDLRPLLLRRIKGRARDEYIFPAEPAPDGAQRPHWRDWPRANIKRICRLVNVPEVCAHSMRGLHSSLAYERGSVGNLVAESMRHTHESVTKTSYATKGAVRTGQMQRALKALAGGKK
jgi:integrase